MPLMVKFVHLLSGISTLEKLKRARGAFEFFILNT